MTDEIQAQLNEINSSFDSRTSHCDLTSAKIDDNHYRLTGSILDNSILSQVASELASTFTHISFETDAIDVLRPGKQVAVGTSVAGLYAEPSFSEEMVSQLLNGWLVELLLVEENWAYVRQPDGYLGWIYKAYLDQEGVPDPTHLVSEPMSLLRDLPSPESPLSGRVPGGTAVRVERSDDEWAELMLAGGFMGWVPASDLRAFSRLPEDDAARRRQIVADAPAFAGVPYLWGGTTAYGIDCSGYVQLLYKLSGVVLPRDADMQFEIGRPVEPPLKPADLLFFSSSGGKRVITHVGLSLGDWLIIHSSRSRNGVYTDDVKAVSSLNDVFVGARTYLS